MGAVRATLVLLLAAVPAQDPPADAVRKALARTAEGGYAYAVDGRFERRGEFRTPDLLTARIGGYRSARKGAVILVKGPEGLWKTPAERLGERVQNPPEDEADKVKVLEEAEAPHAMVEKLLPIVSGGERGDDHDAGGVACRTWLLRLDPARIRAGLERDLETAVARGAVPKPEEVQWPSLKGTLRVWISARDGVVVRAVEEDSVRITVKVDGEKETRTYRTRMAFELSDHGKAVIDLPEEVRKKLGL